ncbi:MAG: hypothetical protein U9N61_02845 [Euryarchaeota archaeon]|nr:hypothetical protein [Euryarchaeota archaeon]
MTEKTNTIYFDLLSPGKPFAGFVAGEFVDMWGRAVSVTEEEVPEYLENTAKRIAQVQDKDMDGLPIDAEQHDKGKAAGWITGVAQTSVNDSDGKSISALEFTVSWTKLGLELISEKIMTNFSPTFSTEQKVVVGGSLTNWPASMDEKGIPLFSGIELSQGVKTFDKVPDEIPGGLDAEEKAKPNASKEDIGGSKNMSDELLLANLEEEGRQALLQQARKEIETEMPEMDEEKIIERLKNEVKLEAFKDVVDIEDARNQMMVEMEKALKSEYERMQSQAGQMLKGMLSEIKRDQDIVEFSTMVTGGTDKVPYGFTVEKNKIEKFLQSLDDKQRTDAMGILGQVWEKGRVGFEELGHGKKVKGNKELPAYFADKLTSKELVVADLRDPVLGLGDIGQYDLSQWEDK